MIYYPIKIIYYAIKSFTIQLIDFVNNLLVPYQILGEKKGIAVVKPGPRRLE